MQDQAAIQLILEYVDFGITGEAAFKAPRFSTNHFVSSFGQGRARLGSLQVSSALPDDVQADLKRRGHNTTVGRGAVGGVALIAIEPGAKTAVAVGPAAASLN